MDLDSLINDYNGAAKLSAGTAEWGYVEEKWFLQIPDSCTYPPETLFKIGETAFGEHLNAKHFITANYHKLLECVDSPDKALFLTMFRYHLVNQGLITFDLNKRCVQENEYTFAKCRGLDWKAANNNIPNNVNYVEIAKYVKRYADSFIQFMVYVFCARGHHWQDGYEMKYQDLMKACSIPTPLSFALPSLKDIFRQSIHAFGVALPLQYVLFSKLQGNMSHPMVIRFTPHPPIAGAAQALTSNAIIDSMRREQWFGDFNKKFEESVTQIAIEKMTISAEPYRYHVASKVLTGTGPQTLSQKFTIAFNQLSPYLMGYVIYLGRRNTLSQQSVISQKSGGTTPAAENFAKACEQFSSSKPTGDNMQQYLNTL